ncbi:MAG: hypothetical protein IK058_01985 [Bacteroidales bacterium]|nr:hypothetical protein [Bacteroidales bacterium]
MKRLILVIAFMFTVAVANAQNCEAIVLPFFKYDTAVLANYPVEKMMYRCFYSQASFYESDTVPAGVDVYNIGDVREAYGTNYLPQSYVVDLSTLSYYAYNFNEFQFRYPRGNVTICFSTPASTHRYLVLRSIESSHALASEMEKEYYRTRGY